MIDRAKALGLAVAGTACALSTSCTGPKTYQHESGALAARGTRVAGKFQGPMQVWHESGALDGLFLMRDGKMDGVFTYFHDTKEASAPKASGRISLRGGEVDGPYITWYPHGPIMVTGTSKNGEWHGYRFGYEMSGQLVDSSGLYEHGEKTRDLNNEERALALDYQRHVLHTHPNGRKQLEIIFEEDTSRACYTYWFSNGSLNSVNNRLNGKVHGLHSAWFNGSPAVYCVESFDQGKKTGPSVYLERDGSVKESTGLYENGERIGDIDAEQIDALLAAALAAYRRALGEPALPEEPAELPDANAPRAELPELGDE